MVLEISRYFLTLASWTVRIRSLPQLGVVHLPVSGTLRYFAPHLVHLTVWLEKLLRFPIMSGMKCLFRTRTATSFSSTARIFLPSMSCASILSIMDSKVVYAEYLGPSDMSWVSWVNPMPSYCFSVPILPAMRSMIFSISLGSFISIAAW